MKTKRNILACLAVAVVVGCSVASVKADDIYPPPWLRGQPNTTYQDWTFATSANLITPDVGMFNPNGTSLATITGGTWSQFYDNHVGVWTLGSNDRIDFGVPNTPFDDTKYKDMWIQVTWEPDFGGQPFVAVNGNAATLILSQPTGYDNWMQNIYTYRFPDFNPDFEVVTLTGTLDVGQVVIDTQCIPEPSSLALLAVGALGLLVSRKRK